MIKTIKEAYKAGRKAAAMDPQKQQDVRKNIVERSQADATEKIGKLNIQGSLLTEERKELAGGVERLSMGRPIEQHKQNKTMGIIFFVVFFGFLASEFFLLQWTLRPWGLGVESFIISFGLMLAGVVAIEEYLRALHSSDQAVYRKWRMWIVFFSMICFIVSWILLSNARAELITSSSSAQGIEAQIETADNFYSKTSFMYVAIGLASLAIAFMGGIALHEGISRLLVSAPILSTIRRLKLTELSIAQTATRIKEFEVLPQKVAGEFDRGVLDGPVSKENPLLSPVAMIIISLLLLFVIVAVARGEERVNESVIVLFDLSGSAQEKDYLNQTEFQKNVLCVEEIIKQVESGTHLRIVGITDKSFDKPYVILDSKLSKEKGYFSEKLAKEKLAVLNKWKQVKLEPKTKSTDIFGAMILSSILFGDECRNKKLIILSDLRNSTGINMEALPQIESGLMQEVEKMGIVADLRNVEVWALGVSTTKKTYQYWNSLKAFWTNYFEISGANLISYSVERKWNSIRRNQ